MEKNDQIYQFCDTAIISSLAKKQFFIFQRKFINGKNATSFVIGPFTFSVLLNIRIKSLQVVIAKINQTMFSLKFFPSCRKCIK